MNAMSAPRRVKLHQPSLVRRRGAANDVVEGADIELSQGIRRRIQRRRRRREIEAEAGDKGQVTQEKGQKDHDWERKEKIHISEKAFWRA